MRRMLGAAVVAALLAALLPGVALGATPILIVYVGEDCVGFDGAADKLHTLWLLDGTEVLSSGKATSDADGEGWVCFDYTVASGHKVKIQPAGLAARTITIPSLSIRTDRAANVVAGNAPGGAKVWLYVDTYKVGTYALRTTLEATATATAGGAWSKNVTALGDIRGGDEVFAGTETAAGDQIWAYAIVEQMGVHRGGAYAYGYFTRGEVAKVTVRTSAGALRGTATLTPVYASGYGKAAIWSATDQLVYVHATDKATGSFAADAKLTVPAMTVKGVAATDVVTVACPGMAGQGVRLVVQPAAGDRLEKVGLIGAAGTKSFNLAAAVDLRAGDLLTAYCKTDPGDEVGRTARVGP